MPRTPSPLRLLPRAVEPAVKLANGWALFCSNASAVAAKDIPRLERRGKMEALRKAEENSVKVWIENWEEVFGVQLRFYVRR